MNPETTRATPQPVNPAFQATDTLLGLTKELNPFGARLPKGAGPSRELSFVCSQDSGALRWDGTIVEAFPMLSLICSCVRLRASFRLPPRKSARNRRASAK